MRKKYEIIIPGDDYASAVVSLDDKELATVKRVFQALKPDGPYANIPRIIDIDAEEKRRAEAQAKELHVIGRDIKTPTAMEEAFARARAARK